LRRDEISREDAKACLQNRFAVSAPEARKQVAHGETVGINVQIEKAPDGAKEISVGNFLPPLPGLEFFG
jgi:hypothetical protein